MARAEEIPRPCQRRSRILQGRPLLQYLLHHREELDDAGLKKTSILPVLNYAQAWNSYPGG